jgi:hypothetical protein
VEPDDGSFGAGWGASVLLGDTVGDALGVIHGGALQPASARAMISTAAPAREVLRFDVRMCGPVCPQCLRRSVSEEVSPKEKMLTRRLRPDLASLWAALGGLRVPSSVDSHFSSIAKSCISTQVRGSFRVSLDVIDAKHSSHAESIRSFA